MVIYRNLDGKPGFQQTDSLDEAIRYVERLRNDDGVESARIYRLEQVEFSFEPFYRVRVGESGSDIGSTSSRFDSAGSATSRPATGTFGTTPREVPPRPEPMASEGVSSARPPEPPESGSGIAPTDAVGDTGRVISDSSTDIGAEGDQVRRGLFGR